MSDKDRYLEMTQVHAISDLMAAAATFKALDIDLKDYIAFFELMCHDRLNPGFLDPAINPTIAKQQNELFQRIRAAGWREA